MIENGWIVSHFTVDIASRSDVRLLNSYLRQTGASGFELVPSLLLGPGWAPNTGALDALELPVRSLQSLLFGLPSVLQLFTTEDGRSLWRRRLEAVERLCGEFSNLVLVLGSPAHRRFEDEPAHQVQSAFERVIGDLLGALTGGSRLVLESNPAWQGAEFLNSLGSVLSLVQEVGDPRLGVNLDLDCLAEDPTALPALSEEDAWRGIALHVQCGISQCSAQSDLLERVLGLAARSDTLVSVSVEETETGTPSTVALAGACLEAKARRLNSR